jgi:hypothetical protein
MELLVHLVLQEQVEVLEHQVLVEHQEHQQQEQQDIMVHSQVMQHN